MNTKIQLGLIISCGLIGVLILIGIIVLLTKFFMRRFRKKAWDEINALPKQSDSLENNINYRKLNKRRSTERQPLYQSATNNAMNISDGQISIPINENNTSLDLRQYESTKVHEHTIVEIQRDRLNHIKEEEQRIRPMIGTTDGEDIIQRTIDEVQKEFDESLSTAAIKMKHHQDN
ncbi:unnamed protein product [Rotaria sp. Silwood1]|nr:unnamed protein product [Rotaria sp. Silwood1]CAF3604473.1 unnamed protein product [Rotaria sp. Silwood1]CAF3644630.1 unnamed protein product [Rotaria sp. Silwood1]CAF4640472.1 unnamed protein product [Rotaria sp. Silwood1]CAF4833130.1 unnamed protein product [Rotaria sp. Silwood1]